MNPALLGLLQLPPEVLKIVFDLCIQTPEHTCEDLISIYGTCHELRHMLLPWIGASSVFMYHDAVSAAVSAAVEQLDRFPRAATLRLLDVDLGEEEGRLTQLFQHPAVRVRLASLLKLCIKGHGCTVQLSAADFSSIAVTCPNLRKLELEDYKYPLSRVRALSQLTGLRALSCVSGYDDGLRREFSAEELDGLASLVQLTGLELEAGDGCLEALLPRVAASLTSLASLTLCWVSDDDPIREMPQFSCLRSLAQLTLLGWSHWTSRPGFRWRDWDEPPGGRRLHAATACALCCITQLVSLHLESHIVKIAFAPQLLSMPCLKSLSVSQLKLAEALGSCSTSLEELEVDVLGDIEQVVMWLPVAQHVKRLFIRSRYIDWDFHGTNWGVRRPEVAGAVSAVAATMCAHGPEDPQLGGPRSAWNHRIGLRLGVVDLQALKSAKSILAKLAQERSGVTRIILEW